MNIGMTDSARILLVFALYSEAKPFIEALSLKSQPGAKGLQVFSNVEYVAVITGTGKVSSAIGTTYALARFSSIFTAVNIGLCGSSIEPVGNLFLIDKITDEDTGRTFYPDILSKSELKSGILRTVSQPFIGSCEDLIDMESSGFYEAASNFLDTHQIQLLKIVSDKLDSQVLDKKSVQGVVSQNLEPVLTYLRSHFAFCQDLQTSHAFSSTDLETIQNFLSEHYFTVTEEHRLFSVLENLTVQTGQPIQTLLAQVSFNPDKTYTKKQRAKVVLNQLECLLQQL